MASIEFAARPAMANRMVVIVFRNSLESDVMAVLREMGVDAFTGLPEVHGTGETGDAFAAFGAQGANGMVLAALDHLDAARLVRALRGFRDRAADRQRGAPIPLKVFVLPCIQAV
jgi:hypothetical protein